MEIDAGVRVGVSLCIGQGSGFEVAMGVSVRVGLGAGVGCGGLRGGKASGVKDVVGGKLRVVVRVGLGGTFGGIVAAFCSA